MIETSDFPLLEFDEQTRAFFEPSDCIKTLDMQPEKCVVCFFQEVIDKLSSEGKARVINQVKWENGVHKVYEIEYQGQRLAVFHPSVGAPMAAGLLEDVIAMGSKKFIACGGAGVLDKSIGLGHIVIPKSALRDEGTSYHYLPPSREVDAGSDGINAIEEVLTRHGIPYLVGKTWTTDGVYSETPDKMQLRMSEGCITVEMECAAFLAVAKFRNVIFAQLLYGGDDLSSDAWDSRDWQKQTSVREKLFWLAVEACSRL